MRHERGEGEGEGLPNDDGLLSPALSSIVPLEEREQSSFAFTEEFCLTLANVLAQGVEEGIDARIRIRRDARAVSRAASLVGEVLMQRRTD